MGDVIGDINTPAERPHRSMDTIGGGKMIRGYVPLAENVADMATDLRSRTGRDAATISMF